MTSPSRTKKRRMLERANESLPDQQFQNWSTPGKGCYIFINIFSNAIQAMPEGGKIIIRSYEMQLEEIKDGVGR